MHILKVLKLCKSDLASELKEKDWEKGLEPILSKDAAELIILLFVP